MNTDIVHPVVSWESILRLPNSSYSTEKIANLKEALMDRIYQEKSYDVPKFCIKLGLEDGTIDEAHSSKRTYARSRLSFKTSDEMLEVAKRALALGTDADLLEAYNLALESKKPRITALTRRRILDFFSRNQLSSTEEEIEFLRKLWPTTLMRSEQDYNIKYDVWTGLTVDDVLWHFMVNNQEWTGKEALKLVGFETCSEAKIFHVLSESVSPIYRTPSDQLNAVSGLNAILEHDGLGLMETRRMSGAPFYEVTEISRAVPSDNSISDTLKDFDPDTIHVRWTVAMERRDSDPEGAITIARTLLEDVCKWILEEAGEDHDINDLPKLYRKVATILNLAPDSHTEQVFKQILGSCQQIVEQLGSLRNKISDSHSSGPRKVKPRPRHAALAVNLSGAMATFLVSTWREGLKEKTKAE